MRAEEVRAKGGGNRGRETVTRRDKKSRKRKKIAVVAVARKLGVLLHRLWVSGEAYDPFYATKGKNNEQLRKKKVA